jgi:hypothetical protein
MHAPAKQTKVTLLSGAAGRAPVTAFSHREGLRSCRIVSGQHGIAPISFLADLKIITPESRIHPPVAGRTSLSPAACVARVQAASDDFLHARKAGLGGQHRGIRLGIPKGDGADPLLEFGEMMRVVAQGADADAEQKGNRSGS